MTARNQDASFSEQTEQMYQDFTRDEDMEMLVDTDPVLEPTSTGAETNPPSAGTVDEDLYSKYRDKNIDIDDLLGEVPEERELPPIDSLLPTQIEIAMAIAVRNKASFEGLKLFKESFTTIDDFNGCIGKIINCLGGAPNFDANWDKIQKLLEYPIPELERAGKEAKITENWVTPFNMHTMFVRNPRIAVRKVYSDRVVVKIADKRFDVRTTNERNFMTDIKPILEGSNALVKNEQWRVAEYSMEMRVATFLVCYHADVDVGSNGNFDARLAGIYEPPYLSPVRLRIFKFGRQIAERLVPKFHQEFSMVRDEDKFTQCYWFLYKRRVLEENPMILADITKLITASLSQCQVGPDEFSKAEVEKYLADQPSKLADEEFKEAKEDLASARAFRAKTKLADEITHDACVLMSPIHMGETRWALITFNYIADRLMDYYVQPPRDIFIHGPGSPEFVKCIRRMFTEEGKAKGSVFNYWAPGNAIRVEGARFYEIFRDQVTGRTDAMIIMVTFAVREGKDKMDDNFERFGEILIALKEARWKGVMALAWNLAEYGHTTKMYELVTSQGFKMGLEKHPRLHNDALTLYVFGDPSVAREGTTLASIQLARANFMFNMKKMNEIRNLCMTTGFTPINKTVDERLKRCTNWATAHRSIFGEEDKPEKDTIAEVMRKLKQQTEETRGGDANKNKQAEGEPESPKGPGTKKPRTAEKRQE